MIYAQSNSQIPKQASYGISNAAVYTPPAMNKGITLSGSAFTYTQKEVDPFQAALDAQIDLERHEISERVKLEAARPGFALFCTLWGAMWCYLIQCIWAWAVG